MHNVMASAAEAKWGALFNNTKDGVALHITLNEMGHLQPANPVQVDYSTTHGFPTDKFDNDDPNLWTCVSIGYRIESTRNNFMSTGDLDTHILQTISPSIAHLHIISAHDQPIDTIWN
jgi:hypothetical protein